MLFGRIEPQKENSGLGLALRYRPYICRMEFEVIPSDVWYLEMVHPVEPPDPAPSGFTVEEAPQPIDLTVYRSWYNAVGRDWNWMDRVVMPDAELEKAVNGSGARVLLLLRQRNFAGYGELLPVGRVIDLKYFGLTGDVIGKGIGRWFLGFCVHEAWKMGAEKVTVNTCSLDHPKALSFYQKGGFQLVETCIEPRKLPLKSGLNEPQKD